MFWSSRRGAQGAENSGDDAQPSAATVEDLLTAYAAGTTSPGLSLLCAAHLTLAPESRRLVAALEEIGGAMLAREGAETEGAAAARAPSLSAMLALLDGEDTPTKPTRRAAVASAPAPDRSGLPAPIRRALGEGVADDIPWRFRLPGISEHTLQGFDRERVSLLRARPGSRVPGHTHEGVEATLILKGAMRDGDRVLTRGDVGLCGPEDDHHPEIVGDEKCVCLIVVDGAMRFTGRFGRALNLFAE